MSLLAVVLLGYALAGKGFAYVGLPPLFIGEITLGCGLVAFATAGVWFRVAVRTPACGRCWRCVAGGWPARCRSSRPTR